MQRKVIRITFSIGFMFLFFTSLCSQTKSAEKNDKSSLLDKLSITEQKTDTHSGILSLENGGESLIAKLWLAENAASAIDIQIFSFEKDGSGLIAADYMVRAADRGIKVRLLIDDLASRMYSHEMRLFDSHENIEVRVYNPAFAHGQPHRRIIKSSRNSLRLQNRMHNKILIFDKELSIIGGRNIGDKYADYDTKFNFRDREVLIVGKTLDPINKSFEHFWNDSLTVPYVELSGKRVLKLVKDADRFKKLHDDAENSKDFCDVTRDRIKLFPKEVDSALKNGTFIWTKQMSFVTDSAGKNAWINKNDGSVCTDTLIEVLRKAKHQVIIQSPYFIFTDETEQILKEIIARGVKVKLLTNSMASIDSHNAFSAYRKERKKIIEMGVELYEYKPDPKIRYKLMLPDIQAGINYKAEYGFHSKTVIADSSVAVIGSYNFDPRSHIYNTECIVVIRSEKFALQLLKISEEETSPENSWRITSQFNPDKKAGFRKRASTFFSSVIPKRYL